ncbi:MAG TPA: rhodanese-like domain-containing protein [Anaerolineae bacterium]|nr:rhodanese-like domain-containing protein [Anaerolineae bacterium]
MSNKKTRQRQKQRPSRKTKGPSLAIPIIVGAVVLVIVAAAIISFERERPASAELPGSDVAQGDTVPPLSTNPIPYPNVPRISVQETQGELDKGQAILVDVRSKTSYDKLHAAGAISIPEEEIEASLDELPRDKTIILYCT